VTKISVVVPVYNPGAHIDDCIRSLLDQSMPAGDYEAIFVDDGSTDGTGERLDELAAAHPHVRVRHIPNSGWPGRPRNLGMDMAEGEFVLFVDNDDWLEREALDRMHTVAVRDGADIVIGKVVGHGKPTPPTLFVENRSGLGIDWPPMPWLLTPHRLFRRTLLQEHGLRFPEGRRRLEDHVFVLGALFRTNRVSVLADYPCYHWMLHARDTNASADEFDPAVYYRNLQEVLDVVDEHTEPGPLRDRLYLRWYRGKVLSRVGGHLFLNRAPQARRARLEEIKGLMEARFPPALDARLPFLLRVRAALARRSELEQLERLAELETRLELRLVARDVRITTDAVELQLEGTLHDDAALLAFEATADGTTWTPPASLASRLPPGCLDATGVLEASDTSILIRAAGQEEEFLLPATTRTRIVPDRVDGRFGVALDVEARVPLATAAAGRPLEAGDYVIRALAYVAGFRLAAPVTHGVRAPRVVLALDGNGQARVKRPTWKQRVAARTPALRRFVGRAKRRVRGQTD
jgi:glycosyltransferase involved in cell wall biosynthesis